MQYREHQPEIPNAEYIVRVGDGATLLCHRHALAFQHTMQASLQDAEIYEFPADEEPAKCQACYLADQQAPRILLPH